MKINLAKIAAEARRRLIETGGRTAQELGLGRIVGQILVYLYLSDGERSLDRIGEDLELSKASVSIAARQLESMGFLQRTWKRGDRKNYFRTADNIETAFKQGLLTFLFQKIRTLSEELNHVNQLLENEFQKGGKHADTQFLQQRIKRAKLLSDKAAVLIDNPFFQIGL